MLTTVAPSCSISLVKSGSSISTLPWLVCASTGLAKTCSCGLAAGTSLLFSSLPQAVSASKTATVRARYLWWRFTFYFQLSIGGGKRQNFNGFTGILPECVIKGRLKTDCFFRRPFAVTGLMSEQVVHVGCLPLGCRLGGLVCFRGRLVNRLYRGFAVFRTFVDRLQRYFTAV